MQQKFHETTINGAPHFGVSFRNDHMFLMAFLTIRFRYHVTMITLRDFSLILAVSTNTYRRATRSRLAEVLEICCLCVKP